ncbi:DUF6430 domain-containing protein [Herbiconiux sp. CPCC 203406]|uniref:macro domain-containing protein n=1 Tax=Herbiconiux oxytropis TaxID=2970915 RepID=UPI00217E974B|nr:macro domain-containing protein [Herbiconiux oxytropis]MCS5723479.1 DUF6430 domain-containing protein [Herbiconiux oxytropis]
MAVILSFGYGAAVAWPRPVEASFHIPNTKIRVVRGDLFKQGTHIVVGTCDTFDTAFPFISPNSVQGAYLNEVYRGDVGSLDAALNEQLVAAHPVETIGKAGKTVRYEVGTVIPLRAQALRHFFVAYTTMDLNNKAHGTADGLWKSLGNLWSSVRVNSNGTTVSIPVIGGGLSGLSPVLPSEDAIRFIALSFIIASRADPVCEELRIVALPALYDKLNHLELQAFLSGLARS